MKSAPDNAAVSRDIRRPIASRWAAGVFLFIVVALVMMSVGFSVAWMLGVQSTIVQGLLVAIGPAIVGLAVAIKAARRPTV